jgi:hypothetical protein
LAAGNSHVPLPNKFVLHFFGITQLQAAATDRCLTLSAYFSCRVQLRAAAVFAQRSSQQQAAAADLRLTHLSAISLAVFYRSLQLQTFV